MNVLQSDRVARLEALNESVRRLKELRDDQANYLAWLLMHGKTVHEADIAEYRETDAAIKELLNTAAEL